jgi:hypothetical protein
VCITEGQAKWQGDDPKLSAWKQYASYFELYSLLLHETGGPRLHPAFLYFSPFRGSASTDHFQANLSSSTFSQILAGYLGSTSTSRTSLIRSASLYFAEKHRILEGEALDQGFLSRWQEDPEVQLVTRHLERLGYEWTLELVDPRKNLYEMQLTKDDMQFDISQASSGEKEIVNYILGIFALNLQDGLLAVDEVELHLHPRWQALLLDILFELSKDTGNQILLSTHSPIFVTPTSVGHVVRVFRDDEQVSRLIKVEDPQDQQTRNTIHIVNAHNNAKMFFADRIILVEGIQDRLVFERLVELFREARESIEVVEVLDVHGKGNFLKYRSFLDRLSVPNTVIADLDYLCQVGKDEADALFITNDDGIDDNVLKNKKSRDRGTLSAVMREALEKNDLESLERLWRYIESRHIRLKDELSVEEMALLKSELKHLEEEGIYLLSRGEIEDYLPEDKSSLEGTVHLIEEPAFEKWLWNNWANGTGELVGKVAEILGAREGEIVRIRALAKKRATGK